MVDIDNLVLEQLRMIRGDIQALRTDMREQFLDVKGRLGHLEEQVGAPYMQVGYFAFSICFSLHPYRSTRSTPRARRVKVFAEAQRELA